MLWYQTSDSLPSPWTDRPLSETSIWSNADWLREVRQGLIRWNEWKWFSDRPHSRYKSSLPQLRASLWVDASMWDQDASTLAHRPRGLPDRGTERRTEWKYNREKRKKNWYLASVIVCLYALMHVYSLVCLSRKLDEGREMGLVGWIDEYIENDGKKDSGRRKQKREEIPAKEPV